MSELAKALLAFQKEAPELHKGTEGQVGTRRYKYLSLDDAMAAIRPVLNKHGLVVSQILQARPEYPRGRALVSDLIHAESGDSTHSVVILPDTDDMQALGSAITYARRYSLISMLGLVADEDDGGAKAQRRDAAPPVPPELAADMPQGDFDREPDPQQVMRGQLAVIHKRLREQAPKPEGQASWAEVLQNHSYTEFGKTDSGELSEGELRMLVDYANGLLKEEGLATV